MRALKLSNYKNQRVEINFSTFQDFMMIYFKNPKHLLDMLKFILIKCLIFKFIIEPLLLIPYTNSDTRIKVKMINYRIYLFIDIISL